MKRMMHPLHGFHHAMNKTEEATMRKNGWVDDMTDLESKIVIETTEPEKKRGRPSSK